MGDVDDAAKAADALSAVGEQMTGFDAATWRTALSDRTMRSPVIGLTLFDSTPDWARFRARFERLSRLMPVMRKRAVSGLVGLSNARLALDPDFDLDIHLRRIRLPEGTGWEGVLAEARRMSLTDFDHDRPLWEVCLIEGLEDGRAASLLKLHHAIADGQGAVMIGANIFELTAEGNPGESAGPPAPQADEASLADVSRANIADNVKRSLDAAAAGAKILAGLAAGTVKDPVATWTEAVDTVKSVGRFTAVPDGPMSPIMGERSTTYHFAVFDVPFAELRAASKKRGSTVNDLFLASVSTGLARYHERMGQPARELRFNIPISLRSTSKDGSAANAVTIARFPLPVSGASIGTRLATAHEQVRRWRDEPALHLANPLADASWLVPVPLMSAAARASDVTTSNVPGPPLPLYIAGARIVGMWPLVATIGAGTNITMITYDGTAFVGLSMDDRAVTDQKAFVDDIRAGFTEVMEAPVGPVDPAAAPSAGERASHASTVRGNSSEPAGPAETAAAVTKSAARKAASVTKAAARRATGSSPETGAAKKAAKKAEPAKKAAAPKKPAAKKPAAKSQEAAQPGS